MWIPVVLSAAVLVAIGIGPHTGRYETLTVLSGSMRPRIPVGSMVIATPERPRDLRRGQIITYQVPVGDRQVISHRVVSVLEGGDHPIFETRGDANDAKDPWVAKVSGPVVWRVRYVVPGFGRLVFWLRRPAVHATTLRVVPLLIALVWLVEIWGGGSRRTGRAEPVLS
jgi:signal peptidase I